MEVDEFRVPSWNSARGHGAMRQGPWARGHGPKEGMGQGPWAMGGMGHGGPWAKGHGQGGLTKGHGPGAEG